MKEAEQIRAHADGIDGVGASLVRRRRSDARGIFNRHQLHQRAAQWSHRHTVKGDAAQTAEQWLHEHRYS